MNARVIAPGSEGAGEQSAAIRALAATAAGAWAEIEAMIAGRLPHTDATMRAALRHRSDAMAALLAEIEAAQGLLAAIGRGWRG